MNISQRVAGVTFTGNFENSLRVREGLTGVVKHEPLTLPNGKTFPNCVNVYLDGVGKVGSLPEQSEAEREVQKRVIEAMGDSKELTCTFGGVVGKKIKDHQLAMDWAKFFGGDTSESVAFSIFERVQQEPDHRDLGDVDGSHYPVGFKVSIAGTVSDGYRPHPETGEPYKRLTHFLSENETLIMTAEEQKRFGFWKKKFEVPDLEKKERVELVVSRVREDYLSPAVAKLSELDEFTKSYEGIESGPIDPGSVTEMINSRQDPVLGVSSTMGTEIHKRFLKAMAQHNGDRQSEVDSLTYGNTFADFTREFCPFDIQSEEDDRYDCLIFDDELKVSGQYDFLAKNGRTFNTKRVVRAGNEWELEDCVIEPGKLFAIDLKTTTVNGTSKDGTEYVKMKKSHFLQAATYGHNVGADLAMVLYSNGKDTSYTTMVVPIDEWYGYTQKVAKGSRFDN